MKFTHHPAHTRGQADHGWLKAKHSFSFAHYHDPDKMNFGALRVLNDDQIEPSAGFGEHPHKDMEIITIPLAGKLEHKDSLGSSGIIKTGEVQVMSAGRGIRHSEFNPSEQDMTQLLQIWIETDQKNHEPRYDQTQISQHHDGWSPLVGPKDTQSPLWIHQKAWITSGQWTTNAEEIYALHQQGHGVYLFALEGNVEINGTTLSPRDALAVEGADTIAIKHSPNSRLLVIEVPMA